MIERHDFSQQCKAKFNEQYQDFALVYLRPIPETDEWLFTVAAKNGEDEMFSSSVFSISRQMVKYCTWEQMIELLHSIIKSGYEYLLKEAA